MRRTNFSSIVRDPHFRALCVPIRAAYSYGWRRKHPTVPFWALLERLETASKGYEMYPQEYVPALTAMLDAIGRASPQLRCRSEDLTAYLALVEQEGHWLVMAFCAFCSAKSDFVTPAQVSAATGTAESTWRNKAAAGDISGAVKAGKQWLLPKDIMEIVFGIDLADAAGQRDPADAAAEEAAERELSQMTDDEYHQVVRELKGADGLN